MASETFKYEFQVKKSGGTYTIGEQYNAGSQITVIDTYDGAGDKTAILGDVMNDQFAYSTDNGTFSGNTYFGTALDPKSGGSLGVLGIYANRTSVGYYSLYTDQNLKSGTTITVSKTSYPVCFVAGTRIRTVRGEVPVEALAIGDLVVTSSGKALPIRWLGHRRLDCRSHGDRRAVMPIRIRAHALGENRPARDLLVSPAHAICIDVVGEVLIPAGALVNGTTVNQIDVDTITYWHVELDSHDILLAENLAAESYIEMGNRCFFAEHDFVALDATPDARKSSLLDFCRPFHACGPLAELVCDRIAARARTLGWRRDGWRMADATVLAERGLSLAI